MSSPNTNVEKQEKKHKPMFSSAVIFGLLGVAVVAGFVYYMSTGGEVPVANEIEPAIVDEQAQ